MLEDLDAVVIGGGISGLAAAHALAKAGRRFALLEASARFGGCIGSVRSGPYIADMGPQTLVAAAPLRDLMTDLDLGSQFVAAPRGLKRYVFRHGRLVALPLSPVRFLTSPLLTFGAKMRVLREPFIASPPPNDDDESIASFVRRRGGAELLDAVVAPMVAGIFAGDLERLSMRSAFPAIAELERRHGSVVRGYLSRERARKDATVAMRRLGPPVRSPRRPQSGAFARGNQVLIDALVSRLGRAVYAGARVVALRPRGAGFMLECEGLPEKKIEAASVIVATSTADAAELLAPLEPGAAEDLRAIESPPLAQVVLAYPKASVGVPLDGLGFLAAPNEGTRVLGAVWNSVFMPDRCPEGEALVTAFLGGANDPSTAQCGDEEVASIAHRDLARVMHISQGKPNVVAGFRWSNSIPQYALGHEQRIARIRAAVDRVVNLHLIGNFLAGPGVADCISIAYRATAQIGEQAHHANA